MRRRSLLLCLLLSACPRADDEPAMWTTSLALDEREGALLSVWGPAPDDVWAVGGGIAQLGDDGTGIARRWDGTAWTESELPTLTPLLNWVHGDGNRHWAVGNAGAAILHDGTSWRGVMTPTELPLWGVYWIAEDDVWAVGGDANDPDSRPVAIHWDGATWTLVDLPVLDRPATALFKVWATAASDVWAVGDAGVVVHWDGTAWTQVDAGTGSDLISLWGTGPDDIVAVGGRGNGVLVRWDGSAWTASETELPGLNGVWVDGDGEATIVGALATVAVVEAGSNAPREQTSDADGLPALHAAFGFSSGERFAVGGSFDRTPPWTGIALHAE